MNFAGLANFPIPQSGGIGLLLQAHRLREHGKLVEARETYGQLIAMLEAELAQTIEFNERVPAEKRLEVASVVNRLLDPMLMLADLLEADGRRPAALELRQKARALAERHLGGAAGAERDRQEAAALQVEGRFNEALTALARARDVFEARLQFIDAAVATADLAETLEWLGDFERALMEAERAEGLIARPQAEAAADDGPLAALLGPLCRLERSVKVRKATLGVAQVRARIARYTGRHEEAVRRFGEIEPLVEEAVRPAIRFHVAAVRVEQGRHEEGLALLQELVPLFGGLLKQKLHVLLKLQAEALLGLGRPAEALQMLEKAQAEGETYFDPDAAWKMRWLRARILERLGREDEALAAYLAAADAANALRLAPLGWRLDSTRLKDKFPLYRGAIALAARRGDAANALRLIEMVKSRALTAVLGTPRAAAQRTGDEGEAERLSQLADECARRVDALLYSAGAELSREQREERQRLLARRAEALERLRIAEPRWRAITSAPALDVAQLQQRLRARDQACLSLFHEAGRVTAVLVSGNRITVDVLALTPETQASLDRYVANLQSEAPAAQQFDPLAAGLRAEGLIPPALLEPAMQAASIVVVPHGPLHLLPWAGVGYREKRLFNYLVVGVLPNAACLLALDAPAKEAPHAALLGAPDYSRRPQLRPLKGAAEELSAIAELYARRERLFGQPRTGADATEAAFWELSRAPQGSLLHVACHARFDADDPSYSALQLADGELDATEVQRARLPFNEVVLSGCATGRRGLSVRGVELLGDDIVGLPAAFLEAGASCVLVSIPLAADAATRALMTHYHRQRLQGLSPMIAFNRAQRALSDDPQYPAPLWVGFTLYGAQ